MTQLGFVIVGADFHPEFDFLDLAGALLALFLLLGQLILELAEVGNAADRGIGRRGNLDEIKAVGSGFPNGLVGFVDTELLARGPDDDAHFAGANAVVDTNECWINGASVRLETRNGDGLRAEWRGSR
jgi:hypothetical protein